MEQYTIGSRLKNAWNAFKKRDPTYYYSDVGNSSSYRHDRPRLARRNERTIIVSIFNRIASDVSALKIQHCRLDDNDRYIETIDSNLNNCLTLEANIDQTARTFILDAVMTMLEKGSVALVPTAATADPNLTESYDVITMRVGEILEWRPAHVKIRVYNEETGNKEDVVMHKKTVAIIENPFYSVMNEPNSTMQRLIKKLSLLDAIDEQSSSGKLDMIIHLPYATRTETRRDQADKRRKEIEMQLTNSKYGIAYADANERITQLNRPVENNLMTQIEYLTSMLYSQLGINQSILDGTADEQTQLNYNNRLIEPIISVIVDEMKRTFLSKTARSQRQSIMYFREPFKLVPMEKMAESADKFTRNEIMSKNEWRQILGMKPSDDPKADELINSNISQSKQTMNQYQKDSENSEEGGNSQNGTDV